MLPDTRDQPIGNVEETRLGDIRTMRMNHTLALTAVALAAISLSACKDEARTQTETTEKAVMSDGTQVETTTQSDITVDEHGNRSGTVESTTTVDPEGLMNKETVEESHEEIQE